MLVSRDGSRKEDDCDPRMGISKDATVRIQRGYLPVTQEDKLGEHRVSYKQPYIHEAYYLHMYGLLVCA